jgi:hypothetical protein
LAKIIYPSRPNDQYIVQKAQFEFRRRKGGRPLYQKAACPLFLPETIVSFDYDIKSSFFSQFSMAPLRQAVNPLNDSRVLSSNSLLPTP